MIAKSAAKRRKDIWDHSSAGRALALQARGHRFEPCWSHSSGQTEYGGVAQLARAHGSYPWCQEFESPLRYARYCAGKAKMLACAVLVCSQCHPLRFGSTWLISAHYQKFMAWEIASLFFSLLSRLNLFARILPRLSINMNSPNGLSERIALMTLMELSGRIIVLSPASVFA